MMCRQISRPRSIDSGFPKPSGSSWPAWALSMSPKWCTTACAKISRSRASSSWIWTAALREHPDIVKEYFGTVIPPDDNKLAALNSVGLEWWQLRLRAEGVQVEIPLQAYFRINAENAGQFERTLIIAEPGSYVHYVEGCTAPTYSSDSLHSAVVEIIVKRGARVRYTTIQNWSKNVYNLVTKRTSVYGEGTMEWVDGNLGSKLTMKYPSCYLLEPGAKGEILSVAFAGDGQHQDAGGKIVHAAPQYHRHHFLEVDQQGSGPDQLSRPGEDLPGHERLQDARQLRCAAPGRGLPLRYLPVHGDRRAGRRRDPRGNRQQDR